MRTAPTSASGLRIDVAPPAKTPPGEAVLRGEPVDMGSGLLLLPAVDVELPGALPLVLERLYRSSYRSGRFFGPTWASTLDQHLADANNLWQTDLKRGDKAVVPVNNGPVGINGRTGELTSQIQVYRTRTGYLHSSPGRPG